MNELSQTQSQARLQKIIARENFLEKWEVMAGGGSWQVNILDGNVEWSEEMYRIFGYTPQSFKPSVEIFLKHVHSEDRLNVENAFTEAGSGINFKELDFRIIDQHGLLKYLSARYLASVDTDGRVIKITGLVIDITKTKLLELQVKDSEAYYKASIENSVSAFLVTNNKSEILETNDVACTMFGYTNEELKDRTLHHILEDNDPKFVRAQQYGKKTGRMRGEVTGTTRKGETLLLEITSTQFLNANNEERVISSMVDITSRKIQEETLLKSNERFEYVSKATIDVIWDWDVKSKKLYLGDRFVELFGHQAENDTGDISTWHMHIHPEDKERVILSRLNMMVQHTESTWKDEYRYIKANGGIAHISDRGILLRNNIGTYRMIGVMQNVTELKENEMAIGNLNKSLERRAEELAVSNEELERFAYVASHDLQEPLRMVTSFLQLLQRKYESQLDETAQKYINYAVDGAQRMKTLILDLLDYSRISSDKNTHKIVNTNELLIKTLQVLKPVMDESEASIIISGLPQIPGNAVQLMRLFQNLIGNALKYRSALTPVIEIGFSETSNEWKFFVKDNGIGVDAKYFEKIFIIFKRLHSRTEYSGTGIGLAICKKIIDLHGGRIWLESSLQTGSTFYFTISKFQKDY